MREAAKRGTRFISISPLRDDFPPDADARWLPIRPGTDVAVMLAIAHTLLAEGLHDRAFLRRYTTGFDIFARYLRGEDEASPSMPNGPRRSPDWMPIPSAMSHARWWALPDRQVFLKIEMRKWNFLAVRNANRLILEVPSISDRSCAERCPRPSFGNSSGHQKRVCGVQNFNLSIRASKTVTAGLQFFACSHSLTAARGPRSHFHKTRFRLKKTPLAARAGFGGITGLTPRRRLRAACREDCRWCEGAWGLDADRHDKPMIRLVLTGHVRL